MPRQIPSETSPITASNARAAGCLGDKHVSRGCVGKIATHATALAVIVQGLLCAPSLIST